ncbi:DUF3253 domain-containing protein [Roseomonas oryzicola]|uniref:DUF3253 domain-containing protein n=1 Tax=Neoroseomonas oryzicola TaxID=535904 RepID=A0A9X9WDW6_9PROT|nr:DUF3253 domain-containing protein [Neoroseomonas oryzicola]NKE20297.1 DUF3253 domain-containing protein [Neoroseomonas oryzicola]
MPVSPGPSCPSSAARDAAQQRARSGAWRPGLMPVRRPAQRARESGLDALDSPGGRA